MVVVTAMDMTRTILILTPVLMPVIKQAGIGPVYFGALFIINTSTGLVTPPVDTVLNVVAGRRAHEDGRGKPRRAALDAGGVRHPCS